MPCGTSQRSRPVLGTFIMQFSLFNAFHGKYSSVERLSNIILRTTLPEIPPHSPCLSNFYTFPTASSSPYAGHRYPHHVTFPNPHIILLQNTSLSRVPVLHHPPFTARAASKPHFGRHSCPQSFSAASARTGAARPRRASIGGMHFVIVPAHPSSPSSPPALFLLSLAQPWP